MAEPKTKPTKASVAAFLAAVEHEGRRKDAKAVDKLMRDVTGEKPMMWGSSIVGYGSYESRSGDWPIVGFAPRKSGKRQNFLAVDRDSPHTLIFYESPHRLAEFLADALAVYGDRPAAIANELTKLFESVRRGTLSELIAALAEAEPRGEYVVVIGGSGKQVSSTQ